MKVLLYRKLFSSCVLICISFWWFGNHLDLKSVTSWNSMTIIISDIPFTGYCLHKPNTFCLVVITAAQFHSIKPELKFHTTSNFACAVSKFYDGENLWQWSLLRLSTIMQIQFIVIFIICWSIYNRQQLHVHLKTKRNHQGHFFVTIKIINKIFFIIV